MKRTLILPFLQDELNPLSNLPWLLAALHSAQLQHSLEQVVAGVVIEVVVVVVAETEVDVGCLWELRV